MWHYLQKDQSVGPMSREQLLALITAKTLPPDVLVWAPGEDAWKPAREAFDLTAEMPPPVPGYAAVPDLSDAAAPEGWSLTPPHPWRRYFARMLDTLTNALIVFGCLGFMMGAIAPGFAQRFFRIFDTPIGGVLDVILSSLFAALLNAAFIGFTGSSLGKWFFGIKVLKEGRPMGYGAALRRELIVWVKGMGLGIPIIVLFTMAIAWNRLTKKGSTSWDDGLQVLYQNSSASQTVTNIAGFILLVVTIAFIRSL